MDQGIERGTTKPTGGKPQWNQGTRQILEYTSETRAVLHYGVNAAGRLRPQQADPPLRLVARTSEQTPPRPSSFTGFLNRKRIGQHRQPGGRSKLDIASARIKGAGWHGPAKWTCRVDRRGQERFKSRRQAHSPPRFRRAARAVRHRAPPPGPLRRRGDRRRNGLAQPRTRLNPYRCGRCGICGGKSRNGPEHLQTFHWRAMMGRTIRHTGMSSVPARNSRGGLSVPGRRSRLPSLPRRDPALVFQEQLATNQPNRFSASASTSTAGNGRQGPRFRPNHSGS